MINGAELAQALKERLLSYLCSALPVGNHASQELLGQRFFEAWQQGLFKGPYFETIPPYLRLKSLAQRFAPSLRSPDDRQFAERFRPKYSWSDVDHRFLAARPFRDRLWPLDSHEADLERTTTTHEALWMRGLFKHQWDAFERGAYEQQNIVVATGTGSGKTECFQLPILYRLLTEPRDVRARRGVRALLVYPLNALVEDQSARLRRLLFWLNLQFHQPGPGVDIREQITFGRYTGDTPVNSGDHSRRESDEALKGFGELLYRDDMQASPPDILITNFTMLEYMLLREDDRRIFGNAELFSFMVLDEIHTYSGTQGMEVAMLLRRLRGFLEGKAKRPVHIQCIGTSATLAGDDAKKEAASFAGTLFGTPFATENIILGTRSAIKPRRRFQNWGQFLRLLAEEGEDSLGALLRGEELQGNSNLCERLAQSLGLSSTSLDSSAPLSERLGVLVVESGLVEEVRAAIESQTDACIDLDSLAEVVSASARDPRTMVGNVLGLLALCTQNHEPVLSLRTHLFINETKSAQLCLFPNCEPAPGGADAWWRRLYVAPHSSCDVCGSRVYSALLCRRCGFVYLEGWKAQTTLWPELDISEKPDKYERWLFRPLNSDLPAAAREIGEARTLCLECGRYFVGRNVETFPATQADHGCASNKLLDIWIWRPEDLEGGKLETCLFCEQHWFPGEEVVTGPAPSPYAVSTLLLEELKRQFSKSRAPSKILSFSDTRQQAARLALRLQETNRDFSFRQMVYQSVSEAGLSAEDLLDELFDFARSDTKLRLVLAADPARTPTSAEVREQLATLLYREAVTAYLTLEAQGLVEVKYDPSLFETAREINTPSRILSRLSEDEKRCWFFFLLDWGMRFVRYALGTHKWGGPTLSYEDLKEWNIYPKTAAIVGSGEPGIVGFTLRQRNKRNTVFNFASRLLRRGFGDRDELDIEEFHAATKPFWSIVLASSRLWVKDALTTGRPLLNLGGTDTERCLIQLNLSALYWRKAVEGDPLFRCDHCGRLAFYSIRGICPIRDCSGTLLAIGHREIEGNRFSPVRHYRRLVSSAAITPLRVDEHTAQISPTKRIAIERDFRDMSETSIDVVCGSTTFELGIDLGSIQSVFMSNLPPRAANYRQRAGRAGRRPGAQPFVLNYVRQRPHDQYFWNAPQSFIAGPLPVPRLSISSKEVVLRHVSAILVARLLEFYRSDHPGRMALAGPPTAGFVEFALSSLMETKTLKELQTKQPLSDRLDHLLEGLPLRLDKAACWKDLRSRLQVLKDTYLSLHGHEGCLDVLSDHGILPSYAFPIYVDELRLRECPLRESPRVDLKLQRDRSIALREYSPGRAFVAGKYQILSEGLWNGYDLVNFGLCPQCSSIDFRSASGGICSKCHLQTIQKTAVVPRGGFFGRVIRRVSESIEEKLPEVTDVYFDPAEDPPPQSKPLGQGLSIALLDAREMRRSRMRMFNPRPIHEGLLMASHRFSDAGLPHSPPVDCLERITGGVGHRLYLMHEFTTDILQVRFSDNRTGSLLLQSALLQDELRADIGKREWLYDSVWLTIATALSISGAQVLDVDPTEIAVVLRKNHDPGILAHREIILYDTTAGGAGYARQLGDRIAEIFAASERRLANCHCQDSCYACLRTYHNQLIHARLSRRRVSEGFSRFVKANF